MSAVAERESIFRKAPLLAPALALGLGLAVGGLLLSKPTALGLLGVSAVLLLVSFALRQCFKKLLLPVQAVLLFIGIFSVGVVRKEQQTTVKEQDLSALTVVSLKYQARLLDTPRRHRWGWSATVALRHVFSQTDNAEVKGLARISGKDSLFATLKTGDIIRFRGKLKDVEAFDSGFYKNRLLEQGVFYFVRGEFIQKVGEEAGALGWRDAAKQSYLNKIEKYLPQPQTQAVAKALLLGDKTQVDKDLKSAYNRSGTAHLLALSGSHIAILLFLLVYFVQVFNRWEPTHRFQSAILLVLIMLFAFLVGFSPSVLRSVIFASLYLIAYIFFRKTQLTNIFSATFVIQLLIEPRQIYDAGFQLSYTAVAGILYFYPLINVLPWIKTTSVLQYFWKICAITLSAQLFVTPVLLYHFGSFSVMFLPANFIAHFLMTPLLFAGMLFLFLPESPYLSEATATATQFCIETLNDWIKWFGFLPYAAIENLKTTAAQSFVLSVFILLATLGLSYWQPTKLTKREKIV